MLISVLALAGTAPDSAARVVAAIRAVLNILISKNSFQAGGKKKQQPATTGDFLSWKRFIDMTSICKISDVSASCMADAARPCLLAMRRKRQRGSGEGEGN
jgi:hypothetical protein